MAASPADRLAARLLRAPGFSAPKAALLFVRWAEELAGGSLGRGRRKLLEQAQARLVLWGTLHDRVADGDAGAREAFCDLLPLQSEAQLRLSAAFGPRHPFWSDWRRLVRQQAAADRWELGSRGPARFGEPLVRRLGRKATLWRWPAAAVARLLGRARAAAAIDRAFDDLFAALQLLDDVADAGEDAQRGQPNAVLAAGRARGFDGDVHAAIIHGIAPAFGAARKRLRRLYRLRGGLGAFARSVLAASPEAERTALASAQARALAALLGRLAQSERPASLSE